MKKVTKYSSIIFTILGLELIFEFTFLLPSAYFLVGIWSILCIFYLFLQGRQISELKGGDIDSGMSDFTLSYFPFIPAMLSIVSLFIGFTEFTFIWLLMFIMYVLTIITDVFVINKLILRIFQLTSEIYSNKWFLSKSKKKENSGASKRSSKLFFKKIKK